MSDSEGETEYGDEETDDENTNFGVEEENNKEKDQEAEHEEGDKDSVGSGGFDAGDDEKKTAEIPKETPMTAELIKDGISMLCKTGDGLEIAYVKLVVRNHELTNIFFLSTFIHLRYVDLSNNKLTSLTPLQNMMFLVSLKVAYNQLTSPQMSNFAFLQVLDLTGNQIKTTRGIKQHSLEKLILVKNQLEDMTDMTAENLPSLVHLSVTQNALRSLAGLQLPTLSALYAADNKLKSLAGVSRLPLLTRLHLRNNRITSLAGCDSAQSALVYLNVRGNGIDDQDELHELRQFRTLQTVVISENPVSNESESYRVDVLVYARRLQRIDKEPVEEEEREEAAELYTQREEDRLASQRDRKAQSVQEDSDDSQSEPPQSDQGEED